MIKMSVKVAVLTNPTPLGWGANEPPTGFSRALYKVNG